MGELGGQGWGMVREAGVGVGDQSMLGSGLYHKEYEDAFEGLRVGA